MMVPENNQSPGGLHPGTVKLRRAVALLRWLKRAAAAYLVLCLTVAVNDLATPGRSWPLLVGMAFAVVLVFSLVWVVSEQVSALESTCKPFSQRSRAEGNPNVD